MTDHIKGLRDTREHVKEPALHGDPRSTCATCSNIIPRQIVWWDALHEELAAVKKELAKLHEYVDTIEPELRELRKLRDDDVGSVTRTPSAHSYLDGEHAAYLREFPNSDPRD